MVPSCADEYQPTYTFAVSECRLMLMGDIPRQDCRSRMDHARTMCSGDRPSPRERTADVLAVSIRVDASQPMFLALPDWPNSPPTRAASSTTLSEPGRS